MRSDCREKRDSLVARVTDLLAGGFQGLNLLYLEEPIKLPRLSILRLSGKDLSWLLEPPCHSFLSPESLL